MGWFPCECCGCDCLTLEQLPSITIEGMTGGSWEQSTCCWTKTFTFNTAQTTTTTCLPSHSIQSFQTDVKANIYITNAATPPTFTSEQSFPLPLQYCCESGKNLIGSLEASCGESIEQKVKVSYRRKKVQVRLSRQNITCNGVDSCKLVLSTSYVYEYGFLPLTKYTSTGSLAVTAASGLTCFEQNTSSGILPCSGSYSNTSGDFDCTTPTAFSAEYAFTRVKFYDAWPTGTVTINNSSIPESGCTIPLCNNTNYETQLCLSATGSDCTYSCPPMELVEQSWRPLNSCANLQTQYVYQGCNTPFPTVDFYTDDQPDFRLCPQQTRTALKLPSSTPDNQCNSNRYPACYYGGSTQNSSSLALQIPSYFGSLSSTLIPPWFSYYCISPKNPGPSSCYYSDPCGNPFFAFKYGQSFGDVTDYNYTNVCTNTTQNLCIQAPTWTITFA